MKSIVAVALAAFLFSAATVAGSAMDGMQMGGMHGSMMPSCMAGDPVVGVNTRTKVYMSKRQMKMKMAGMSMSEQHAMMRKHHVVMMCKSKADAMGGRMMVSNRM